MHLDFWRLDAASSSIISVSVVPTAISEPRSKRRSHHRRHINGGERASVPRDALDLTPPPGSTPLTALVAWCPLRDFLEYCRLVGFLSYILYKIGLASPECLLDSPMNSTKPSTLAKGNLKSPWPQVLALEWDQLPLHSTPSKVPLILAKHPLLGLPW